MSLLLTCVKGVGNQNGCPSGMIPEVTEGYVFPSDPTVFDTSAAAEYFVFSFGTILTFYLLARAAGSVLEMFKFR